MDEVKIGNRMVRARQYPWGTVQVESEAHCDFVHLREMLLRTNLEDLRSSTHTKHYELYRRNKLCEMGFNDDTHSNSFNLQEVYETKRHEHMRNMQDKEDEMRQTFVARVKEKENELKEAEQLLHEKFESLRKRHAEDKRRLEERRQVLDDEMTAFYNRKQQIEMQMNQSAKNKAPKRT